MNNNHLSSDNGNESAVLLKALEWRAAGLSVIPIRSDGSKGPALPSWKEWQSILPTDGKLKFWFSKEKGYGIGIVLGSISGNLSVLDFEYMEAYEQWCNVLGDKKALIQDCPIVHTGGGGVHVYFRSKLRPPGGKKLASRMSVEDKEDLLIETRGQGNYVIAPGSPSKCHPSGKSYELVSGSLSSIPILEDVDVSLLLSAAKSLNRMPGKTLHVKNWSEKKSSTDSGPRDCFNIEASWGDILQPKQFVLVREENVEGYWQKPNSSDSGYHLTTNYKGSDRLYCFSTSCKPFEEGQPYTKFETYALLHHNGDSEVAERAIVELGYTGQAGQSDHVTNQSWSEEEFGDPMFFENMSTPEMSADCLPTWAGEYAKALSEELQTPPALSVMMVLSVLGTCLQKHFEVCPYGDMYREPLNIWTVTVLPPATRKTAVVDAATAPLSTWEREQAASLEERKDSTETERNISLSRIDLLQKNAAKEDSPAERARLQAEIGLLKESLPEEIRFPRVFTNDVTPERLQGLLSDHGERMSLLSDEGGIFEVLAGLYSDGKANIDVFLKAHAGSACVVDRATRQVHLAKPALTFGLAIQPQIISEFGHGNKQKFRGNGLLARFLYCIPKSNVGSRDVKKRVPVPAGIREKYCAEITRLLNISSIVNENGVESPRPIDLAPDALSKWEQFSQSIEDQQGENGTFERIQDWTGKLPGAVLRIAGIFHIVEFGQTTLTINGSTMDSAIKLGTLLISHAQKAFDEMGTDPVLADARFALDWIRSNAEKTNEGEYLIKQNALHKASRFSKSKLERVTRALSILQERNITSRLQRLPTKKPTYVYFINPALMNQA